MSSRRSTYSRRKRSIFLVAIATLPLAVISACGGDDTAGAHGDAGGYDDATSLDVSADSTSVDSAVSCAVDAGSFDSALVASGMSIVMNHGCAGCHGGDLSGNNGGLSSTNAEDGVAFPPNLTPDPITGLGCWTNTEIENAILNGIDRGGHQLCNPMPAFASLSGSAGLSTSDAEAVVAYLRSLPIVVNQVPATSMCVATDGGASDADAGDGD
jgi:mono/diheme cytochrome c family protein